MSQLTNEVNVPDFNLIKNSAIKLKNALQTYFGKVYLEKKILPGSNVSSKTDNTFDLKVFAIIKENDPIYKTINSPEDVTSIRKIILDKYASNVVDRYWELFEKVEDELDSDSKKTLEIIGNNFQKKQRKIESSLKKFAVDDGWNIERIQREFSIVLQKVLRDLLDSTIDPVVNGMKSTGLNVYDETILILNHYLSELGVYTKEYKAGDEYTDEELEHYLNPRTAEDPETKDKSFQFKIRSVESVVYLFKEDVVIREANIVVWRIS